MKGLRMQSLPPHNNRIKTGIDIHTRVLRSNLLAFDFVVNTEIKKQAHSRLTACGCSIEQRGPAFTAGSGHETPAGRIIEMLSISCHNFHKMTRKQPQPAVPYLFRWFTSAWYSASRRRTMDLWPYADATMSGVLPALQTTTSHTITIVAHNMMAKQLLMRVSWSIFAILSNNDHRSVTLTWRWHQSRSREAGGQWPQSLLVPCKTAQSNPNCNTGHGEGSTTRSHTHHRRDTAYGRNTSGEG
jgi:hypothetical protein